MMQTEDQEHEDHAEALSRRRFLGSSLAAVGATVLVDGRAEAKGAPKPKLALATLVQGGFLASVATSKTALVKIRAWPNGSPQSSVESSWIPTGAAHVAKIEMGDVGVPGGSIAWRPLVKGHGSDKIVKGEIHKLPARPPAGEPSAFSFAHGSCILQGQPVPALDVARQASPVFFAMLGDLGYQDNPALHPNVQNYKGYSKLFRRMLARGEMAALLRRTPLFAVQDDHDYGRDGCWRDTIQPYAARAFADLVPGAVWPGPNHRTWSIGEVDFFLTDNRRFKDPPSGPFENGTYMSVLGAAQRGWLLSALAASTAKVKIVFIPMTMTWYWSDGEVTEVLDSIRSNVSGRVIFLSGDKHAGGFAHYPGDIWEMLAGPIENPMKHMTPARPNVVWTENGTDRALYDVVGIVNVDTLTARTITLRLMRNDGVELHREVVPIEPPKPVVGRPAQGLAERNNLPNIPLAYNSLDPAPNAQGNNQRVPGVNGYATNASKFKEIAMVVINAGWHQLQDDAHTGTDIRPSNIIDRVLDDIRSVNAENPDLNMKASLRVYAGIRVPAHIRNIAPGPLRVRDGRLDNLVGPFWVPEFSAAYADLQRGLAARYDGDPLVTGTVTSQCAMFYTECYVRNLGSLGNPNDQMPDGKTTGERLRDAGYTDEINDAAIFQMFQAHDVWRSTPSICAFNPYPKFNATTGGSAGTDAGRTNAHMDVMRSILGNRAVLANRSIRRNNQPSPYGPVGGPQPYVGYMSNYQHMVDLGQPILYQTADQAHLCENPDDPAGDCWDDPREMGGVLDWATSYGPNASFAGNAICVELVNSWASNYDVSTLRMFNDRMKNHTY